MTVKPQRNEQSNYLLTWQKVGGENVNGRTSRFADEDSSPTTTTVSTFSDDYIPSDEFMTNLQEDGFVADEIDVYTNLNKYGKLSELDETTGYFSGPAEWDRAQIAKTQQRMLNFWVNNFSDKDSSLRNTIHSTYQITNQSSNGENNHLAALKDILANVKNLPDSIKLKTIPKRDAEGKEISGETMTLEEFANEALADSSNAILEKYIDSPGMRAALTASARSITNSQKFKSDLRYDREYSSGMSQAGHAIGGTLGTAATIAGVAGLGWAAAAGVGALATFGSSAAAGATAGAIAAGLFTNPVGWAVLGVLAVGAVIAVAATYTVGSQAASYIGNNRNDAPSFANDGLGGWIGWSFNNMMQGLGLRSNANNA